MKRFIKLSLQKIQQKIKRSNAKLYSTYPLNTKIGKYVVIEKNVIINNVLENIGDGTYICAHTEINNCKEIGKYCSIANDVSIGVGNHPTNWITTSPLFYSRNRGLIESDLYDDKSINKPTIIGNDVWIGRKAIIMSGVKIDNGAIIAAGAVVTSDVKAYEIVGGVPARRIRSRFSNEIVNEMINLNISNLEIEQIKSLTDKLDEPDKCIKYIKNNNFR